MNKDTSTGVHSNGQKKLIATFGEEYILPKEDAEKMLDQAENQSKEFNKSVTTIMDAYNNFIKRSAKKNIKLFEFKTIEGTEIVLAEFPRQAINYYFNRYHDDLIIDELVDDGIEIREIKGEELDEEFEMYDVEIGKAITTSYKKIVD